MAIRMEVTPPLRQKAPTLTTQGSMPVLNAVSNLTVQRTIVEAFVKLVVCRKVTVQQVEAISGHILDSHTTQEEELPVILDVHRHEIGDVRSALGSSLKPHTPSQPQSQSQSRQGQSGSCATSPPCGRTDPGAGSHGNSRCSSVADSVQQHSRPAGQFQGCSRLSSGKENSHGSHKGQRPARSAIHAHRQGQARRSTEWEHGGKGSQVQSHPLCKKRKIEEEEEEDVEAFMTGGVEEFEAADLRNKTPPAVGEVAESFSTRGVTRKEENGDRNFARSFPDADPAAELCQSSATLNTADFEERIAEKAAGHTEAPLLSATDVTTTAEWESDAEEHHAFRHEKTDDSEEEPALVVQRASQSSPQQSDTQEQAMDEDDGDGRTENCSEPAYDDHDSADPQEAAETTSPGIKAIGLEPENETVTVFVDGDGNLSTPHNVPPITSSRTSNPASLHDDRTSRDEEDCVLDLEYDDNQPVKADQERSEYRGCTSETSTLSDSNTDSGTHAEERSNVGPEPNTRPSKTSQPCGGEDEAELDMLVIDISSSVSEQTNQMAEGDSASSVPGERTSPTTERLDPFAHLFETGFPPLDRTHDNSATHPPSKDGESHLQPGMSKTPSDIRKNSPAATVIKTEPEDDCMITAAFITPKGPRESGQGSRSASHTVTSQRGPVSLSAAPGIVARGSHFAGRASQHRQGRGPGSWEKWDRPPAIQQFNLPAQALQRSSGTATAYQVSSSHADPSTQPSGNPATPQAYMPNFLAAAPHSSERVLAEALPSHPQEGGGYAIDYSQRTYQCVLCCKIFLHKQKFDRHLMMCGGHRPFKCKVCSKGFNQQAHLDTHMKFHIGIKRHRCDLCRKAYVMKGDLIRHLKTRVHLLAMHNQGLQAHVPKWESDSAPKDSSSA